MTRKLLLFSALLFVLKTGIAQGSWELKKNENGIAVYTRKAAKGSIKELRVVCELDATKAQLINALVDIKGYSRWVYSNKKSTILKTVSPQDIIYYTESKLPWPIKDRDLIIELNIKDGSDLLDVQAKSLPAYLPQNANYIRVPYSFAQWKVTGDGPDKIKIDYTFSVDPGGSIPSWLVNATLTIGPYNSFMKLKEVLKSQK
jgi:hypothetical protein